MLRTDVQAPGHPLLRIMWVAVDSEAGVVRAGLFGFIGGGLAVYRAGDGCTVIPSGRLSDAPPALLVPGAPTTAAAPAAGLWPSGAEVRIDPAFSSIVADNALAGPGMRAIVVLKDGRIVAERYSDGFDATVPQLDGRWQRPCSQG